MRAGLKINDIRAAAVGRIFLARVAAAAPLAVLLPALYLSALPAAPASAATVIKSYGYFTLNASTLDELEKQLQTRGPKVESSGGKHPGATRMQFKTRTTYVEQHGRCRVDSARTVLKVEVILPRWRPRRKPEEDTRIIWDTLDADIRRHESQHVDIGKNYARRLEQSIEGLGSARNCAELQEKVKQATASVLEAHDRAQQEFDHVEGINFEDRFQRLLTYRLEQMDERRQRQPGKSRHNR